MEFPNFPNTQMVVDVNPSLRRWWENIRQDRAREVAQLVGGLTFLIYVIPDRYLIKALLQFWNPTRAVFKFEHFELTPTVEEIGGFTDLSYYGGSMIIPHQQMPNRFLRFLGLKYNPGLTCLNFNWISLDFLYSHFGYQDGYRNFSEEFSCSAETWESYRVNAFAIALLGTLVFPKRHGKIHISLSYVVQVLARSVDRANVTLVPMIVAEIMRASSKCVRGRRFIEGCNLLLQLWAVEHFHLNDIRSGMENKIHTHSRRMTEFVAPVGTEEWYIFLKDLSAFHVQWKYPWLNIDHATTRGEELCYLELVGLTGVQPYAPLRVLRQFGKIQRVPSTADMKVSGYDFGLGIPQVHDIVRRWGRSVIISLHEYHPHITPEYSVWISRDAKEIDHDEHHA